MIRLETILTPGRSQVNAPGGSKKKALEHIANLIHREVPDLAMQDVFQQGRFGIIFVLPMRQPLDNLLAFQDSLQFLQSGLSVLRVESARNGDGLGFRLDLSIRHTQALDQRGGGEGGRMAPLRERRQNGPRILA